MSVERPNIVGVWELRTLEMRREDGEVFYPLGESVRGKTIYTAGGTVAAFLIPPNRPHFTSGDQEIATVAEVQAAFQHVTAYYGRYTVAPAGDHLVYHIEASVYPNYEGQAVRRNIRLEGDRLEVTTAPLPWGGAPTTVALVYTRAE